MPVGYDADMKLRPASLFSSAIFVFSLALLVAVGAWYLQTSNAGSATSLHLTHAEWQDTDTRVTAAPPLSIDRSSLPPTWQAIVLPATLPVNPGPQTQTGDAGQTPLRTTWIRLTPDERNVAAGPLMLYGARIKTSGNVTLYANGRLVQRVQAQGELWNSLFTPLWVPLDQAVDGAPLQEILIRVEHAAETPVGLSSLWIGPAAALQGRYYLRQWLQRELPATLSAAFMAVGIFALFVWFRRRHETSYLLFFNLAAVSFVGHLHYYVSLPIVSDWFAWLTANALFWLLMVIHLFCVSCTDKH